MIPCRSFAAPVFFVTWITDLTGVFMRNWLSLPLAAAALFCAGPAFAADLVYLQGGAAQPTDPANPTPALQADRLRGFVFNRQQTGPAELHLEGIDNIVVLDGDATLVYGGDISDSHMISEGEFQGAALGGDTKTIELHANDIVQIPAGTPQWIKPHGHVRYVVFRAPGRKD
jgi:mannose-6-phosphate isomerase-like protein (cupin superfamily)